MKYDGELYVDMNQLKRILLRYMDESTKGYLGKVVRNDTELQEYGIVVDNKFKSDNAGSQFINEYIEYKREYVDYNSCEGNNYTKPSERILTYYGELLDSDLDEIYKLIDEN